MNFIIRLLLKNYRLIILISVLVTIPAAYFTTKLYGNLKPDLEELLPRKSRSILDLDEIRSRLQAIQSLGVLIYSDDPNASRRFVVDLAGRLEKLPRTSVASVEYRIDKELKFFSDRKVLFLEHQDLKKIRNYIYNRLEYEKSLYNPLNIFSGVEIYEPQFDFKTIQKKYESQAKSYDRFPRGFYATTDEKKRLLLAFLPAEKSGIEGVYAFKKLVEKTIHDLKPSSYARDIQIRYTGGVQDIIEEHSALVNDIESSAEIVFSIVLVAILLFFRSWLATGILLLSLFMARFWTFGAAWFAVGSLNANSAFMGSIVLGSGITFGVMLLSRYLEERRKKRIPLRAARTAMLGTARATWTAALAAGFAYGALYFTEFEGFKQYGIMGFMGMVLCWISSIAVLPALLLEVERWRPLVKENASERPSWFFGPLTCLLEKYPGTILAMSIVVTVFSLISLTQFDSENILEKNLTNLRNKTSMASGSGFYGKDADEIMGSATSPLIVLAHDKKHALEIARRIEDKKQKEGKESLISGVGNLQTFIPSKQPQKISLLREVNRILPQKYRAALSPEDRTRVEDLLNPNSFNPISESNLPSLVKNKFTEKDGSIGRVVVVDPRADSSRWSGNQLNDFVESVRKIADEVENQKVPVAGTLTVTSDMIASITRDGPKASALAFISVVVLILLLFRKPRIAALMLSSLVIGNLWMIGFIIASDLKINFLNFIAFPITFGIGVDYGVNVFDRYLHDPDRDILRIVRETGGAVGLCSFTTIVGYSSLLIAQNQAFVSFGALAVLGEVTSVIAAVISLPALLLFIQKRHSRIQVSPEKINISSGEEVCT
jgi:predicted RND superfamily exporter protein